MKSNHRTILLVDDDPQWVNYFAYKFEYYFSVMTVSSFQSALERIEAKAEISLVILDLTIEPSRKMASITGLDIIRKIRKLKPDLPIVIYTSYPLEGSIPASYLEVDLIVTKEAMFSDASMANRLMEIADKGHKTSASGSEEKPAFETKKIIEEMLNELTERKAKTLSIPGEGNFELIDALVGYRKDMEKQLSKYDYSKNVFLMMKFRENNKELGDYIIENLQKNGFNGVRADKNEWNITHNVYNPIAVLYCCKYGIALFDEAEEYQTYSPNVAYELGIMHTQNKKCLILKHPDLPAVPFDLVKDLYITYKKDLEVRSKIGNWISQVKHYDDD